MWFVPKDLVFSVLILVLLFGTPYSSSFVNTENKIKSAVFWSPKFELGPGSVINRYYYDIDFPKGHVALKSFNAEVVDEAGHSIPLHETYLHHWTIERYHQSKHATYIENDGRRLPNSSDHFLVRNSGICQGDTLPQYFGFGSETRGTVIDIPDPFGIEIGNPEEVPEGFEETWMVNVHAIDTRGVKDKMGCTECKCDLYNVRVDENGKAIGPGYIGGYFCCYDNTHCKLKEDFDGPKRSLYLRYTVKWVDWDDSVVPVKIYIIDVTDTLKRSDDSKVMKTYHNCMTEYRVESCSIDDKEKNGCVDVKKTSVSLQTGGYVIYGVGHQHSGGIGSTLYGQDKMGCTECKCELYNVTVDENGKAIGSGYKGGYFCCYDNTHCKLKEGFEGPKRSLYLRYTVKWVDWDDSVVPVKIYIFDVTDTLKLSDDSKVMNTDHDCKTEYRVESCSIDDKEKNGCVDVKKTSVPLQTGGYVIYGVAHQHSGGIGSTLYGQDGRVICSSIPSYGNGNEAGNESGYIVGMSTCYPKPDSVKIFDGETLIKRFPQL